MGQGGKPSFTEERQVNKRGRNPRNGKLLFYILNRITISGKDHGLEGVKDAEEQTGQCQVSIYILMTNSEKGSRSL